MDRTGKVVAVGSVVDQLLPTFTSSPGKGKTAASREQVVAAIAWVELQKQLNPPLNNEQRSVLRDALLQFGWSHTELKERAKSVALQKTFNTIALEFWVADIVCTRGEAYRLAEEIIEGRRREFEKSLGPDPVQMAKLGLGHVEAAWEHTAREMIRQAAEEQERKFKLLRAQYFQLPEAGQEELFNIAITTGILERPTTTFMAGVQRKVVPQLVPKMVEAFENVILKYSTQPQEKTPSDTTPKV